MRLRGIVYNRMTGSRRSFARKRLIVFGACMALVACGIAGFSLYTQSFYTINDTTRSLVGEPAASVSKKFIYAHKEGAYYLNKEEIDKQNDENNNKTMLASVQSDSGNSESELFGARVSTDAREGVNIYDNNMGVDVTFVPKFEVKKGKNVDDYFVYPLEDRDGQLIYTPKNNGIKEDVVLHSPSGDKLSYSYEIKMSSTLEARLLDSGDVGIFSADPALYGDLTFMNNEDRQRVEEVKSNSEKNHLVFAVPAPIIYQTASKDSEMQTHEARAEFSLNDNNLTVTATGLESLQYPISIDPSIVVTSSADFKMGNNEHNINFNSGNISRAGATGGITEDFVSQTSMTEPRWGHDSFIFNDYVYAVGGNDGTTEIASIERAQINTDATLGAWNAVGNAPIAAIWHDVEYYNNHIYMTGGDANGIVDSVYVASIASDGTISAWQTTTSLPEPISEHTVEIYDGKIYVLGGYGSSYLDTVYFADILSNGEISSWQATSSFSGVRSGLTSFVQDSRLYIVGGLSSSTHYDDVQYAPIKEDGSLGAWATLSSTFDTGRGWHSSVAVGGYIYILGGFDSSGNELTDVQFSKIKANGTLSEWKPAESMTMARTNSAAVAYNEVIYVLGGYDENFTILSSTESANIQPAGAIGNSGQDGWEATTGLPEYTYSCGLLCWADSVRLYSHTSVVYNDYVYIIGGARENGATNQVRYAPINSNGTLGSWTATSSLGSSRQDHASFAYNGYIYAIGGIDSGVYSSVEYAAINGDGSLGSWSSTDDLNTPRLGAMVERFGNNVYIINGDSGSGPLNSVERTTINSNGALNLWVSATGTGTGRVNGASVIAGDTIYITGGHNGSSEEDSIEYTQVNSDGTLQTWQTSSQTLSTSREQHTSVFYQGRIYVLGGNGTNSIEYAPINKDGDTGAWYTLATSIRKNPTNNTVVTNDNFIYDIGGENQIGHSVFYSSLHGAGTGGLSDLQEESNLMQEIRQQAVSVATDTHLYVIGGRDESGTPYTRVEYAAFNNDGSLAPWQDTASFPYGVTGHKGFIAGDYLYIVGGFDQSTNNYTDKVWYAQIKTDGSLGSWQETSSLTAAKGYFSTGIINDYVYVVGGFDGSATSTVEYALITSDGSLGTWQTTGSIPNPRYAHSGTAVGDYLYLTGGYETQPTGSIKDDTLFAEQNPDGSISSWEETNSMTEEVYYHGLVSYGGFMYRIAGYSSASDIEKAEILANGHLSEWEVVADPADVIPSDLDSFGLTSHSGKVYIVGGFIDSSSTSRDEVISADLDIVTRASRYSKHFDFNKLSKLNYINVNGSGLVETNISVDITCSLNPYSSSLLKKRLPNPNITQDFSDPTYAQYAQVSFELDPSNNFLFPYQEDQNISDFSISYTPVRAEPEDRLRIGNHFSDGIEQPYSTATEEVVTASGGCGS